MDRPAPGPYPFDLSEGDVFAREPHPGTVAASGAAGFAAAIAHANRRATTHGVRQRLMLKRSRSVERPGIGVGRWIVQDVR